MNDPLFLDICQRQYQALFAMLRSLLKACPDDLWSRPENEAPFWQQAYHTLCSVDFYLSPAPKLFEKPPFENEQANNLNKRPTVVLSRETLLGYLESVEARFHNIISGLQSGGLDGENPFRWTGPTPAHRLVYSLRHAQHHLGWMASILRRGGAKPADWICEQAPPTP